MAGSSSFLRCSCFSLRRLSVFSLPPLTVAATTTTVPLSAAHGGSSIVDGEREKASLLEGKREREREKKKKKLTFFFPFQTFFQTFSLSPPSPTFNNNKQVVLQADARPPSFLPRRRGGGPCLLPKPRLDAAKPHRGRLGLDIHGGGRLFRQARDGGARARRRARQSHRREQEGVRRRRGGAPRVDGDQGPVLGLLGRVLGLGPSRGARAL